MIFGEATIGNLESTTQILDIFSNWSGRWSTIPCPLYFLY